MLTMVMSSQCLPGAHSCHVFILFTTCSPWQGHLNVYHLLTTSMSSSCLPNAQHSHIITMFIKCSPVMSSRCLPTAQHSLSLKCSPSAHHVMSYQCLPGFHHGSYHCVRGVHCHSITMLIKYSSQSCYQVLTTVMLSSAHNGHVITVHQVFTTGI